MTDPRLTPWEPKLPLSEETIQQLLAEENLSAYQWSNGPHDIYSAHTHPFDKVIYVLRGSITFGLPQLGKKLILQAGDRLDLPANTIHDAQVGAQGVVCLEAHK